MHRFSAFWLKSIIMPSLRSRGGGILCRPPSRTACHFLWWLLQNYEKRLWLSSWKFSSFFVARQHSNAYARSWYSNSVRPSVCHVPVFYRNGLMYRRILPIVVVFRILKHLCEIPTGSPPTGALNNFAIYCQIAPTEGLTNVSSPPRDLRRFDIRFKFESYVPIRFDSKVTGRFENFESPCLPRLPSYQKQHSLFNDKFQSFRHCHWDLYWV